MEGEAGEGEEREAAEGEGVSLEVSWAASFWVASGAALRQAGIHREAFSEAAVISEAGARQETGDGEGDSV